jgi:hypothetical protein
MSHKEVTENIYKCRDFIWTNDKIVFFKFSRVREGHLMSEVVLE